MKKALSTLAVLAVFSSFAQTDTTARKTDSLFVLAPSSNGKLFKNGIAFNASGFLFAYPMISKGQNHLWTGFYTRTGVVDFKMLLSRLDVPARTAANADTVSNVYATHFSLGGNIPYLTPGNSKRAFGIKGMATACNAGFGLNLYDIGGDKAFGAYLEPSYSIQFPFVLLEARMQANFNFAAKGKAEIVKGFSLTPSVALLFDGLWDIYDPKLKYTGTGTISTFSGGTKVTTEFNSGTDGSGNHYTEKVVTTTYTPEVITSSSYGKVVRAHKSFIAWSPRLNLGYGDANTGNTVTGGLAFSARSGIFMFDALLESGKRGFGSAFDSLKLESGERMYNLNGHVNTTLVEARAGLNVFTLLGKVFFARANKQYNIFTDTKFTRLYFGIGAGQTLAMSAPKYADASAEDNLNGIFAANPSLTRSGDNDMGMAQKGLMISKFVTLEIGSFTISLENSSMQKAKLADNTYLHVGYLYPFNKVRKLKKAVKPKIG